MKHLVSEQKVNLRFKVGAILDETIEFTKKVFVEISSSDPQSMALSSEGKTLDKAMISMIEVEYVPEKLGRHYLYRGRDRTVAAYKKPRNLKSKAFLDRVEAIEWDLKEKLTKGFYEFLLEGKKVKGIVAHMGTCMRSVGYEGSMLFPEEKELGGSLSAYFDKSISLGLIPLTKKMEVEGELVRHYSGMVVKITKILSDHCFFETYKEAVKVRNNGEYNIFKTNDDLEVAVHSSVCSLLNPKGFKAKLKPSKLNESLGMPVVYYYGYTPIDKEEYSQASIDLCGCSPLVYADMLDRFNLPFFQDISKEKGNRFDVGSESELKLLITNFRPDDCGEVYFGYVGIEGKSDKVKSFCEYVKKYFNYKGIDTKRRQFA